MGGGAHVESFDFQKFSSGDFVGALTETLAADSLTRVLYPDDSTMEGQGLRFVQEYFLVACSLADLIRRFRQSNAQWSELPSKVAIQMNDTHPAMSVPELMRLLLDDGISGGTKHGISRSGASRTPTTRCCPEALEKMAGHAWFQLLPRHLEIIYEINRRFLMDTVHTRHPGKTTTRRAHEPH